MQDFSQLIKESNKSYNNLSRKAAEQLVLLINQYNEAVKNGNWNSIVEKVVPKLKDKENEGSISYYIVNCIFAMDDTPCNSCQLSVVQEYPVLVYNGIDRKFSRGRNNSLVYVYVENPNITTLPESIVRFLNQTGCNKIKILREEDGETKESREIYINGSAVVIPTETDTFYYWCVFIVIVFIFLLFLLILQEMKKRK